MQSRFLKVCLWLAGIVAFVTLALVLQDKVGLPFDTTYRIVCAGMCLYLMTKVSSDYHGEHWPWVALAIAAVVNIGLFLTPLLARPASRGEIMIFALPDVIILLAARTFTYGVTNDHERAVRQQLILGLVLAMAMGAALYSLALLPSHRV